MQRLAIENFESAHLDYKSRVSISRQILDLYAKVTKIRTDPISDRKFIREIIKKLPPHLRSVFICDREKSVTEFAAKVSEVLTEAGYTGTSPYRQTTRGSNYQRQHPNEPTSSKNTYNTTRNDRPSTYQGGYRSDDQRRSYNRGVGYKSDDGERGYKGNNFDPNYYLKKRSEHGKRPQMKSYGEGKKRYGKSSSSKKEGSPRRETYARVAASPKTSSSGTKIWKEKSPPVRVRNASSDSAGSEN